MLDNFNPLTPLGFMVMMLRDRTARLRTADDTGASAIEWVLITVIVVGIVAAIGLTIKNKITTKANTLDLTTP
ncbi:hypothetical protein [Angustibacter aerolatus]|uniref:Flp family type IVb pilin n=1 Tax=Angustibacter aerolatus TaxID=1162965 RepID=A0ABQ6JJV3_9ACTN|nr:hypothetical protein [Angustibacter aerolatus]GMA88283.1 hypothetical protein GCM10025868_35330 [Angustibacter aerolatus]